MNGLIDILDPPEKWSGLGEAYQVDSKIVVFTQDDATIVPLGALFRRGGDWNVFLVENGRAQERPVSLIRQSGATAAVASGVKSGDILIVYPNDRVTPGIRVQPSAK